jgi:hypothetical protein
VPKIAPELTRKERLAINLFDVTDQVPDDVRQLLLHGNIDVTQHVRSDDEQPDETGVQFTCDLLRAGAICDSIRNADRRAGRVPTRVYIFRERAWTRLPADADLLRVVSGRCYLNPRVFSECSLPTNVIPKEVKRLF